ncbi:MAG: polyprenyl synthetase family protein [Muribaculaceae bacterium]|nr:polyprenyl synthetase family protein [Muribaculaceae bacterium]
MVTLKDIQNKLSIEIAGLNAIISDSLKSDSPLMTQVVNRYLAKKGKQIRPILVLLSGKFFGGVTDKVLNAGAAIEMLHNASLIHDDVIDESQERRGSPTINRVWDNHIAVLVGDYFVSSALHCAIESDDYRIISSMSRLGRTLSLGEINQIDNARSRAIDEDTYFEIIRHKTASLFRSCVEVGGYAAGASDDDLKDLKQFTELLGICFQIKDDTFDYFHDPAIGKPTGNDLREGKITLPLIYALTVADASQHNEMLELSHKKQLDSDEIDALIEFAKAQGGIEYAYSTMERLRNEAFNLLDNYPASPAIDDFKSIFDYIIARNL